MPCRPLSSLTNTAAWRTASVETRTSVLMIVHSSDPDVVLGVSARPATASADRRYISPEWLMPIELVCIRVYLYAWYDRICIIYIGFSDDVCWAAVVIKYQSSWGRWLARSPISQIQVTSLSNTPISSYRRDRMGSRPFSWSKKIRHSSAKARRSTFSLWFLSNMRL